MIGNRLGECFVRDGGIRETGSIQSCHVMPVTREPLAAGTGYVAPSVMLEFGARSTGEPSEPRAIRCDAAAHLPGVEFPAVSWELLNG